MVIFVVYSLYYMGSYCSALLWILDNMKFQWQINNLMEDINNINTVKKIPAADNLINKVQTTLNGEKQNLIIYKIDKSATDCFKFPCYL